MNNIHDLTYESATIALPGTLGDMEVEKNVRAVGSSVKFVRNECSVSAHIPTGIWNKPELKGKYADPLYALVVADLETIDDLIPALQELNKNGKAPRDLMYSRNPETGKGFKVYDCSSSPPGFVFPILFNIKNTNIKLLNPEYDDLIPLARYVDHEEGKLVHVKGISLKEAVERAIDIFNVADRLREIAK